MRFAWDETEALMRSTARVELGEGGRRRPLGTAFFVAERTLLTCAHVALRGVTLRIVWHDGDRRHELPVEITARVPDHADALDPYPAPDVAVLTVTAEMPLHPTAWLDEAAPGDALWAFGYTDDYREGMALGHPARFTKVGLGHSDRDGGTVWSLNADRVRPGMSGAPLLDLATGRVVGILKRTRDAVQALGGFATGMDAILAALPAVKDANAAANAHERDLALAAALWGDLVAQAAEPLERSAVARDAVAAELGLAAPPGDAAAQAIRLARELFVADLDVVVACVSRLKRILDPSAALKVFEAVAVCTRFDGEPWIAPAAAAELDQQVALLAAGNAAEGRVLALRSRLPELRDVYRRRGDRRRRWWDPLDTSPFSHEIDARSGLPADLERELRIGTARRAGMMARRFRPDTIDDATREEWEAKRPRLLASLRDNGVVGLLPCDRLDRELVGALVERYPLVFLAALHDEAPPEVAELAAYQELAPGIDDDRAEEALYTYSATWSELGGT